GSRLAARQDFALDQQFTVLRLEASRFEDRPNRGAAPHVEDAANVCAFLARPDHLGCSAAAKQQSERIDDNRFAAAGLTRKQIQTRVEAHPQTVDHGIILDRQLHQHRADYTRVAEQSARNHGYETRAMKISSMCAA